MMALNGITLLVNGLTLSLSLGFLIIVMWRNLSLFINQAFAFFLSAVLIWNLGSFLLQFAIVSEISQDLIDFAAVVVELGFIASSIFLYLLCTALVGLDRVYIRLMTFFSLIVIIGFRLFLVVILSVPSALDFQMFYIVFYLFFDFISLFIIWRYRRKLKSRLFIVGVAIVAISQLATFLNPVVIAASFSTILASFGALTLGFALLRQEIILPLTQRDTQVETLYQTGLAISRLLSLQTVLDEISTQAATWLKADGVCICLRPSNATELAVVTAHNLPSDYFGATISSDTGIIGSCARDQKTIFLEDYSRDWKYDDDLPHARETFGSVICVPLMYSKEVIGVLMVVVGRHGKLFDEDDVYLLELLSSQVAIAISHSQLFEEQKELNRLKSEMVRMASHDLKNPLMGALTHIELIRDSDSIQYDKQVEESLVVVEAQLDRMHRIIRGILDIERLSATSLVAERCSPYAIVQNALAELHYFIEDHHVNVQIHFEDDLPDFWADRKQFERVIVNLIENAVKFTLSSDSDVIVEVTYDDRHVVFSVKDQGVGIPDELKDRVFDRFYRGKQSGVEHVTGSGLGLSIVKTIVENHNGRICFESDFGIGSTFRVEMPHI